MKRPGNYFQAKVWGGVFRTRNWLVIAFGLAAIVLGLLGFYQCTSADCRTASFPEKLIRTLDLIRLSSHYTPEHDPWPLVFAQLMMPLALILGAIRLFVHNMRRDLRVVLARRMKGHMIVCGLGDTGRQIAEHLVDAGHKVVAITKDNDDLNAQACEQRGIVVLQGDGMEPALFRIAGLDRAACVFVSCGSDAANIEIALRVDGALSKRTEGEPLKIQVELRDEWLYDQILSHRKRVNNAGAAQVRLFNLNANAARLLLHAESFGRAARSRRNSPHLLVIGQTQTLRETVVQLAQCNFALPGCRLAVTLIAKNAQAVLDGMLTKYPGLAECVDFTVQNCDFGEDTAWPEIERSIAAAPPFAVIADLGEETLSMKAALRVRGFLDAAGATDVPVYMRAWKQHQLSAFMQGLEKADGQPDRLAIFGDLKTLTGPRQLLDQSLDTLASAAHEVYRASTKDAGPVPEWSALSEQVKESNRAFADHIPVKLAELGLGLAKDGMVASLSEADIETLAKIEHWRWALALKIRGWRQGERNEIRKTHPLLKPWDALEPKDQDLNRAMVRRIPAIVHAAKLELVVK
jgi:voltage-gated potassium channel Kch